MVHVPVDRFAPMKMTKVQYHSIAVDAFGIATPVILWTKPCIDCQAPAALSQFPAVDVTVPAVPVVADGLVPTDPAEGVSCVPAAVMPEP